MTVFSKEENITRNCKPKNVKLHANERKHEYSRHAHYSLVDGFIHFNGKKPDVLLPAGDGMSSCEGMSSSLLRLAPESDH